MSFILEALKKSENARQRQSGPGFAGLPEKTETRRPNIWPWIIGALLVINAIIVSMILLRDKPERVAAPAVSPPQSATATASAPSPVATQTTDKPAVQSAPAPTRTEPGRPETASTAERPAPRPDRDEPAIRSLADEARSVTETPTPIETAPKQTAATQQPAQQIPTDPRRANTQPAGVSAAELPSVQELYLSGELSGPQLNLDLHVYFPQSSRRVVFISGKRYREGDQLDAGVTVKEIIPAGVILSRRGRDYLLQAN